MWPFLRAGRSFMPCLSIGRRSRTEEGLVFPSVASFSSVVVTTKNSSNEEKPMKKKPKDERDDELRTAYDLRQLLKGGRSKYAERYQTGTNLVLLDPDVTQAFANNAEAINEALRLVLQLPKLPTNR